MNVPSWCTQAASVAVIDTPGVNTSAMFSAAGGQAVQRVTLLVMFPREDVANNHHVS